MRSSSQCSSFSLTCMYFHWALTSVTKSLEFFSVPPSSLSLTMQRFSSYNQPRGDHWNSHLPASGRSLPSATKRVKLWPSGTTTYGSMRYSKVLDVNHHPTSIACMFCLPRVLAQGFAHNLLSTVVKLVMLLNALTTLAAEQPRPCEQAHAPAI